MDPIGELDRLISSRGIKTVVISWPRASGRTGLEVEGILRRFGVRIWGRKVTAEEFSCRVSEAQYVWAYEILVTHQIPVVQAAPTERLRRMASDPRLSSAKKPKSAWGDITGHFVKNKGLQGVFTNRMTTDLFSRRKIRGRKKR